jgi:hypothetical protein
MQEQSWWLTDAAQSQRSFPYTFFKPSRVTSDTLAVGDQVKLIFEFDNPDPDGWSAERMWVTITGRDGDRFQGVLDNEPAQLTGLVLGDPVEFEERHIIQTSIEESGPNVVNRYRARCFVTRRVLYDGELAGYLYREEAEQEDDSGWRIMAGDEDEAYMDEADNIFYVSLGAVLNCDDSFVHLLDAAVESRFERNPETGGFEALQ